jgi:hypothetical protein
MTDPLVLKSPSKSNILDISILFDVIVFVLSLIKLLPPLLIAGLILLQYKLHLVNWDKKEAQLANEMNSCSFILRRISCSISSKLYFYSLRKEIFTPS